MRASTVLLSSVVLIQLFAAQIDAKRSKSPWQTLSGDAPLVIARGGFSGLFPDSSIDAYNNAMQTSVAGAVLWCDVQLTKDGHGICFPDLKLNNASNIGYVYPNRQKSYPVNGVTIQGWFTIDFALRDLKNVSLIRGIFSRLEKFDGIYAILTVQDVSVQIKPESFWLNVQHDAFYAQHNLSISSFLISASRTVSIDYISSPEVNFFRKIARRFGRKGPSLVFQFLGKEEFEPTTKRTYGSILSNLAHVKKFASGILVPKSYIYPLDDKPYLLPPTSLVHDAHKAGLQLYVSGFANDANIAYNYSFDPVSEYLSFVDNGHFSVDGVLSDFPITASASIDCFSHVSRHATKQVDFLVISKNGASGDYPGCTDLAYEKAIQYGADVIDCSVQMSSEGTPFCSSSIDLTQSTMVIQSPFRNGSTIIPEISSDPGIYTFSLTWPEIQSLTPAIMNPYRLYNMFRNPNEKNSGRIISLSEFLNLAKNSTSLSSVLISLEVRCSVPEREAGLDVVKAVLETLTETGYSNGTITTKVMIQSTHSSVLVDFKKQSKYETVYKIEKNIGDISDSAIEDIKKFANAVVLRKSSVFPVADSFVTGQTNVVERLQKSKLLVYVELFHNEFVSQPYDFFCDATVEINTYITGAGLNGTITEFPLTAARYKRNQCLGRKQTPSYMSPLKPGGLLSIVNPKSLPPAEPPYLEELGWCGDMFQCGNITAGFPFWGGKRPDYCGHTLLELHCNNNNNTSLNISDQEYCVLDVDQTYTLTLARTDMLGSFCSAKFKNTTLPTDILDLSLNAKNLTVSYLCDPRNPYLSSNFTCPLKGIGSVSLRPETQSSCNESFAVNVPMNFFPEEREFNLNQLESVLRGGFEVKVEIDEITCQECSSSGGICSFSGTTQVCCKTNSTSGITCEPKPQPSSADLYHRCSTRFICGDQVGLLYPFWIPGREECGHPDFKLTCDRGFSEINIASVKFRILEANYTTRIIRLARSDYIGHLCPQDPTNAPFNENILQFSPNTDLLTLYYDCRDFSFSTPAYDPTYFRELGCDDELGRSYYVTRNLSSPLLDGVRDLLNILKVLCLTIVSIPASGPALSTLQRFQTSDNLKKALEEGFELGVNQECSMCMESGGGCGYNQTTRGFVCYCNNGPHSRTCSSGKPHGTLLFSLDVLVAGVLVLLVILIPILRKRKASHDNRKQNLKTLIPLKHYSYAQVKRITNSFAEVVGEGGFGTVYRGSLSDGSMVAVKVLKDSKCNGEDFVNEVVSMSRTSHVNIVSLLGFCSEGSKRAIVYELLENGSLDRFISTNNSMSIDWMAMHGIALGVARGLEYLHHGCKTRIVHFDIKPQNVLLDDDLCPKVSDFGLAKLCKKKESTMSLLDLRGTIGYIAPEMISRVYGSVSHKSDVYSYGMLVLEMIGARNKTSAENYASDTSSMYFPEWIYKDLEKGDDERLVGNGISNEEEEIAKKMTLVGLWCIQSSPSDRPPMNRVVEMMEGNLDSLEVPPKPVWQIPTVPLPETSWISEESSSITN
ncbi:unnamed protein product [Brassica oleracea var. botrytis]